MNWWVDKWMGGGWVVWVGEWVGGWVVVGWVVGYMYIDPHIYKPATQKTEEIIPTHALLSF